MKNSPRVRVVTPTVLVVDDDFEQMDLQAMLVRTLKCVGHVAGELDFDHVADRLGTFDVLMTDINTRRGLDGLALARSFKAMNPLGLCVVVTGMSKPVISCDVDHFMVKPFDVDVMERLIKEHFLSSCPV